jgi:hypothetical protein
MSKTEYEFPNGPSINTNVDKNLSVGHGVVICCNCQEPAGARKDDGLDRIYWCMKCGKVLSMKQMDTIEVVDKTRRD